MNYLRRKNSTVALKVDELGSQVSAGVKHEAVLVKHVEKQAKIAKKAVKSSFKIMSTLTSTRRKLGLSSRLSGGEIEGYERRNACGNPTTAYIINERIGS